MSTSKKTEIPPHVQAVVDFAFGLHGSQFRAKKGFAGHRHFVVPGATALAKPDFWARGRKV